MKNTDRRSNTNARLDALAAKIRWLMLSNGAWLKGLAAR